MELAQQVYASLGRIGHALADPTRLHIMNLLAQTERSVDELATMVGQSAPNTSAHLKVLQSMHLVERRREGRRVFYRVASREALALWVALRDVGLETTPELRERMRGIEDHETVVHHLDADDLLRRIEAGEITLLDLRPADEYAAGHLPHARSTPFDELEARLRELAPGTRIIAYCRGPFCYAAIEGVARLRAEGFDVRRLFGGVAEWAAEGRALDTGAHALEADA